MQEHKASKVLGRKGYDGAVTDLWSCEGDFVHSRLWFSPILALEFEVSSSPLPEPLPAISSHFQNPNPAYLLVFRIRSGFTKLSLCYLGFLFTILGIDFKSRIKEENNGRWQG
ncbi:unnamed protein product [Linum trigynum]|uniref:Uncharacterized protein n=1 Tax=Linum trigynum TaxID=586398 RepID=A0AAV2G662_9ROSI